MGIFISIINILNTGSDIATGGLSKEFFLSTLLFLILILIMILYIKILNSNTNRKAGKENKH